MEKVSTGKTSKWKETKESGTPSNGGANGVTGV